MTRLLDAVLRRLGLSRDVALLRLVPVGAAALAAGALSAARPSAPTGLLAGGCVLLALAAAAAPGTVLATLALASLVALDAEATAPAPLAVRAAAAVGIAAVLWAMHLAYALAGPVPAGARLTAALRRHWRRRYALTAACSLPVAAAAAAAGDAVPGDAWLRVAGAAAVLVAAAAPLLLTRRAARR